MSQFKDFLDFAGIQYNERDRKAVNPSGEVGYNRNHKTLTFHYEDGRKEQLEGKTVSTLRNKLKQRLETEQFRDGHSYSLVKVALLITYVDPNYLYKTGYMDGR